MKALRWRSGCVKTLLAKALCFSLLLATPGADCFAVELSSVNLGEGLKGTATPVVAPVVPVLDPLLLPNVSIPVGPNLGELPSIEVSAVQAAASAPLSAQVQASAAKAQVAAAAAPASAVSAQASLRAGGEALAKAEGGWSVRSTLSWIFGESKRSGGGDASRPSMPDEKIKFYIAEQGKPTISGQLSELGAVLKRRPDVAARLSIARLATAKPDKKNPHEGLQPADAARVAQALEGQGVRAKLELERVPVDWQRHAERQAASQRGEAEPVAREKTPLGERVKDMAAHPVRTIYRAATWPIREAAFVVKTYLAGVSSPSRQELIGAALTKSVPFIVGIGVWWKMVGPSHPILLVSAIALSGLWEAFHGVLLNSWNTFQNNLFKMRGGTYQTNFNWIYGQLNPAIFRLMSWSVDHNDPARVPPWHAKYWFSNWNPLTVAFWFAMGPISVVGTFIGTIAYRGLNSLYETGRLTRGKRSAIQQGRDLVMMMTGILLGAGMAKYYVLVFLAQQAFDVGTYFVSLFAKGRPVLYVVDSTVDSTKEFHELYPVAPNPVVEPPMKQAVKALGDIPLLYPITLPIKLVRWLWNKHKKGRPQ